MVGRRWSGAGRSGGDDRVRDDIVGPTVHVVYMRIHTCSVIMIINDI